MIILLFTVFRQYFVLFLVCFPASATCQFRCQDQIPVKVGRLNILPGIVLFSPGSPVTQALSLKADAFFLSINRGIAEVFLILVISIFPDKCIKLSCILFLAIEAFSLL